MYILYIYVVYIYIYINRPLLSRLFGRIAIGFSLEVNEDLALSRARVVPNLMNNTGYTCPSFINYNLSVYSLTNLFNCVTNHDNNNISRRLTLNQSQAEIKVVCPGERALLASQSLSCFPDAQVDEIFKTNVYKARYGKPTPNF